MEFGFIGAGRVAFAIARKFSARGDQVAMSCSRGPSALAGTIGALGDQAKAVPVQEAAAAEIVFLAVPWSQVERALTGLPSWDGRILVDTTNPFVASDAGVAVADIGESSSSTIVARHAPGARVVKAFNSILMTNLEKAPPEGGGRRVLFVSGDDVSAKLEVATLIEGLGYAAVDLGSLTVGGRLQQGGGPLAGKDLVMLADWNFKG